MIVEVSFHQFSISTSAVTKETHAKPSMALTETNKYQHILRKEKLFLTFCPLVLFQAVFPFAYKVLSSRFLEFGRSNRNMKHIRDKDHSC